MRTFLRALFGLCLGCVAAWAEDPPQRTLQELMRDLAAVNAWEAKARDRLPASYNGYMQTGYFVMPSARMTPSGTLGIGYAHLTPYQVWSARTQLYSRLEVAFNYRIFNGILDGTMGSSGFGDYADKGISAKFALLLPEDTDFMFPGLAVGADDFLGSQMFRGQYLVATQVIRPWNVELSLGYGAERLRGLFGGFFWSPLRNRNLSFLRGLGVGAEWDSTDYRADPHYQGRAQSSHINYGVKYNYKDVINLSASRIRGEAWALAAGLSYDFGKADGGVPKFDQEPTYRAPVNTEPVGATREVQEATEELAFAFDKQGFPLQEAWLATEEGGKKTLWLRVINYRYRYEKQVRERVTAVLAALAPSNLNTILVVIESEALSCQQYRFDVEQLRRYSDRKMSDLELALVSPLQEPTAPPEMNAMEVYKARKPWWMIDVDPLLYNFWGSSTGKYKYVAGVMAGVDGYLPRDIYYNVNLVYYAGTNTQTMNNFDILNPSQIINVRSDSAAYFSNTMVNIDTAYLQKSWGIGQSWYTRAALGYFEIAYAGAAMELLHYPVNSPIAFGLEAAVFRKRNYSGLGFQHQLRRLVGTMPTYHPYSVLWQGFATVYLDVNRWDTEFSIKAGKFLARDWGARGEIWHYFPSGMRIGFWYTVSSITDKVNDDDHYCDKGFMISIPLDFFLTKHSRSTWDYSLGAWLRDIGAFSETGQRLYPTLNSQRR